MLVMLLLLIYVDLAQTGLSSLAESSHLPSMTLQLALEVPSIKLELIVEPKIYLMIKWGIHGGLSYVVQHHTAASCPEMLDYRSD